MPEILDTITGKILGKALDFSFIQHQVIANNIANINTRDYQPLKMNLTKDFSQLIHELDQGGDINTIKNDIIATKAEIQTESIVNGDRKLLLDEQMIALTQNTLQYQALLSAKSKLGSILKLAISGDRN